MQNETMDSSPSIWDIYAGAKRLLVLQPRIENRTLRENCKHSQLSLKNGALTNTSVDSLSPLSVDSNKQSVDSNSSGETLSFTPTVKESNLTRGFSAQLNKHVNDNDQNGEIDMAWDLNMFVNDFGTQLDPMDSKLETHPFKQYCHNEATTSIQPKQILQKDHLNHSVSPNHLVQPHQINHIHPQHIHPQQLLQQQLQQHHVAQRRQSTTNPVSPQKFSIVSQSLPNNPNQSSGSMNIPNSSSFSTLSRTSSTASLSTSLSKKKATPSNSNTVCFNCQTQKTPLWRRDPNGNTLCNACGLFQKLHGTMRPLSLKTDVIKKRNSRRSSVSQNRDTKMISSLEKNISMYSTPASSGNSPSSVASPGNNNTSQSQSLQSSLLSQQQQQQRYKNVPILPKPSSSSLIATAPSSVPRPEPLRKSSAANSPYEYTSQFAQSPSMFTANTPSPITAASPMSPNVQQLSNGVPVSLSSMLSTSASATNLTNSFNQKRIPPNFQRRESNLSMTMLSSVSAAPNAGFVNPNMLSSTSSKDEDEHMMNSPLLNNAGDQGMMNDLDWLKFDV